jgi:hypothetical protein
MQILVSRAGLVLNPGQVADLVLAWRQVAGLIASLPHERPLADDLAYAFRLPPPASAAAQPARRSQAKPQPAASRPAPRPKAKPPVTKPRVTKPKAATTRAAKPKARGRATRKR